MKLKLKLIKIKKGKEHEEETPKEWWCFGVFFWGGGMKDEVGKGGQEGRERQKGKGRVVRAKF